MTVLYFDLPTTWFVSNEAHVDDRQANVIHRSMRQSGFIRQEVWSGGH